MVEKQVISLPTHGVIPNAVRNLRWASDNLLLSRPDFFGITALLMNHVVKN
jgi:hypothetical protein